MEGFKSGFYTTFKKEKTRSHIQLAFFYLTKTFFLIFRNTGPRRTEIIQISHSFNIPNVSGEAQKADEVCFAPRGLQVKSLWPDEYEATHQIVLNHQEDIQKLKKSVRCQSNSLTKQKEWNQDSYPMEESQTPFGAYHKIRIANPKINFKND